MEAPWELNRWTFAFIGLLKFIFNILIFYFLTILFYETEGLDQILSFCKRLEISYKEAKIRKKRKRYPLS